MRLIMILLFTLVLMGATSSFQAIAQSDYQFNGHEGAPMEPETLEELAKEQARENQEMAMTNARQAAQLAVNTENINEITRMTGTQDFILKLVAIVMPLLIAMMTGAMLYIQIKQKQISEVRQVEQREDLILVARSVNGMKTELVARSELAAFMEGAQLEASGKISRNAEIRLSELQEAVRYATERANAVAHTAVSELAAKQDKAPRPTSATVMLKTGEQQILEGVDFGEEPVNHDAIGVATGELKSVVGRSAT